MMLESSMALGLAVVLALLMLKASMLGLSSNQWTIMQTLSDAYMTRETALSNRIPLEDVLTVNSPWPDPATDNPPRVNLAVALGKLPGGIPVQGNLVRYRTNETTAADAVTATKIYRLYSVLTYKVGEKEYYKSRSTVRTQ